MDIKYLCHPKYSHELRPGLIPLKSNILVKTITVTVTVDKLWKSPIWNVIPLLCLPAISLVCHRSKEFVFLQQPTWSAPHSTYRKPMRDKRMHNKCHLPYLRIAPFCLCIGHQTCLHNSSLVLVGFLRYHGYRTFFCLIESYLVL